MWRGGSTGSRQAQEESRGVAIAHRREYVNRPGPRLVDSLEILVEILHPELFDFAYQGMGWAQL